MARRRWIADTWNDSEATLTGAQAEHLARVLRAQPGQQHEIVTGDRVWLGTLTEASASRVTFRLESEIAAEAPLPLTLLLAVFKFDRFEWAVEKATELGVARIEPALSRRTEKHLAQAAGKRVERWRRIAHEAAQQSRRAEIPEIADPAPLPSVLAASQGSLRIVLSENERKVTLRDGIGETNGRPISIAVGPEGGWTSEEEALFASAGWQPVSLGPRILRAETAATAATAIAASALLR